MKKHTLAVAAVVATMAFGINAYGSPSSNPSTENPEPKQIPIGQAHFPETAQADDAPAVDEAAITRHLRQATEASGDAGPGLSFTSGANARALIADPAAGRVSAVVGTNGACFAGSLGMAGGVSTVCTHALHESGAAWNVRQLGETYHAYGLVDESVTAVDVLTPAGSVSATIGLNAFTASGPGKAEGLRILRGDSVSLIEFA
jgi:hypothetical protein